MIHIINYRSYLTQSSSVFPSSLTCSMVPVRISIMVGSPFSFGSSWLWTFIRLFLFLMTFTVLMSIDQVFYKIYFSWNLCNGFPMNKLDLWGFERKTTEIKCCFLSCIEFLDQIRNNWYLYNVVSSNLSTWNISPFI